MNTIRIDEYKDLYLDEINSLISMDKNYIPSIGDTGNSLLLFENHTIVGIGSRWDNTIHPYREYISIYISPDKRNKGLGKLLFHQLENKYQLKRLQTAFDSDNINAIAFALKCGFELGRKCYCYNVNKGIFKPFDYSILGKIIRLCDLSEEQFKDIIILQYEDYKINHQELNPLYEDMPLDEWKNIISDDLTKEDSFVLINNNNINAYLFCYDADKTSISIGYAGNRCGKVEDYKAFLHESIKQLFTSYTQIELEIDDCDISSNILGKLFLYKPDISWDTYTKGIIDLGN